MPYIKPELKSVLDAGINQVISEIKSLPIDERDGICNYVVSRVVASSMKPETGWRYSSLSRAHEVFNAAGMEFYRRLLGPYENLAINKNGDIDEYKI